MKLSKRLFSARMGGVGGHQATSRRRGARPVLNIAETLTLQRHSYAPECLRNS